MIITSTVGKIDAVIGRYEAPLMLFMEKEEADFAKNSLKSTFYNVKKSKHYAESVASLTGIGDWIATDAEIPYDDFQEGFNKTFVHTVFKKGIEIKRETIDDSRLIDMQNQAGNLIDAANRTKEKFVHAPFNNAASTSFDLAGKTFTCLGADGKALAATDHPSKTGKASNQSNYNTSTPLTTANLKIVEEQMNNFVSDIGEKSNVFPDMLIVPFELRNEAWEIVQSLGKTETANNNVNPYYDKYKVVVSRWLNPGQWFIADSTYMKKCLYWIERVGLEIKSEKDFNTDNWRIRGYERYSLGHTDWRWVIANKTTA